MLQKNKKFTAFDYRMMKRCLQLAKKASGFTAPNPMVGAVIVKDGQIIGEGYHEYFGGPHAEINAISNAKGALKGAHIYVNLEPCSYYGKTPACTLALIEHQFAKVSIASLDPNPLVAGKGVEALRNANIEVEIGLMENEALILNEKFFHFIVHHSPFVAIKTATSFDGKIATYNGESQWITNEKSRKYVHDLRQDYSANMVGIGTVLKDNPSLTVRKKGDLKQPIRIIIDTSLKIPDNSKVLSDDAKTIIATTRMASKRRIEELERIENVSVWNCPLNNALVDIKFLLNKLGKMNIDSVLVEGGGEINFNILENKLAHKIYAFVAPIIIGGHNSKSSFGGRGFQHLSNTAKISSISYTNFGDDILMEGYLK